MNRKLSIKLIYFCLPIWGLLLFAPDLVQGQVANPVIDANGEIPKGTDRSPQQSAYGGEKEDLRMTVEDINWISEPCEGRECSSVRRVRFTVWVEWLSYPGPWLLGTTNLDPRDPDTNGPDAFISSWNDNWTLVSASNDPSSISNTSAYWTGETNCPESPPRTGRKHTADYLDGSGTGQFDTFGFSRTIVLEVKNPAATCTVPTLQITNTYLHTYDDDVHVSVSGETSIGISVDVEGKASVSVGTNLRWANNHGWNKSKFESFDPPEFTVVRCECCEDDSQ